MSTDAYPNALPGITPPTPPTREPERSNCHWEEYEVGTLLCRLDKGEQTDDIALSLNRSLPSCQRHFDRLLKGDAPCPPAYRPALERLRHRIHHAEGKHARGERTLAQYKHLSYQVERMLSAMEIHRKIMDGLFALEIYHGRMSLHELQILGFGEESRQQIAAIVKELENDDAMDATPDAPAMQI